jgi:hypothetical protein
MDGNLIVSMFAAEGITAPGKMPVARLPNRRTVSSASFQLLGRGQHQCAPGAQSLHFVREAIECAHPEDDPGRRLVICEIPHVRQLFQSGDIRVG